MSKSLIILKEKYGSLGKENAYVKPPDQQKVVKVSVTDDLQITLLSNIAHFFRQVFLPQGFPESVSDDYVIYQLWDTVQAFCSTVTGTLATRAIMTSVGVGKEDATPLAATVTWIFRDGTGMVGRILFAWWKGTGLDAECKKWRLFADALNDAAMCIELIAPLTNASLTLSFLCMATAMKAIVGVAGGATRAAVTQHQARRANTADIAAKDGSQETFVNLCASMFGLLLLSLWTDNEYDWHLFIIFTFLHLFANWQAVKSLVIYNLNEARLLLLLCNFLPFETVRSPLEINKSEPLILGTGQTAKSLCKFTIKLGHSLEQVIKSASSSAIEDTIGIYNGQNYLLFTDVQSRTIYVILSKGENPTDVVKAYFNAVILAISICIFNQNDMQNVFPSHPIKHTVPILRLESTIRQYTSFNSNDKNTFQVLPVEAETNVLELVIREFKTFKHLLGKKGWNLDSHLLHVEEWRAEWSCPKDCFLN